MKKIIFLVVAIGVYQYWGDFKAAIRPPPDFSAQHTEGVILYATDWCGYCKKTREFFKTNNIAYVEYDIEKSAEGRSQYDQLHGSGIPLVMIRGEVLRGYDPQSMKDLLKIPQ